MFRSTNRPRGRAVLGLLLLTVIGCRNPFNPSADIELASFRANSFADEIIIYPSQLTGGSGTLAIGNWEASATFVIKNKVGATITSINIVYTDYAGNEVTVYRATGGKTFKTVMRLHPMNDDNNAANYGNNQGEGNGTILPVFMVDRQVISEITAPGYPADRFMFAIITFRGEDDNGYDFKLSAKIGIKYYQ